MSTYEDDFTAWADKTASLLAKRQFDAVDIEALMEEVSGLARSERSKIKSHLFQILFHLLKLQYANPVNISRAGNGWKQSVGLARDGISRVVEDSPSLHSFHIEVLDAEYARARRRAASALEMDLAQVPVECPWTAEQVMDEDFLARD